MNKAIITKTDNKFVAVYNGVEIGKSSSMEKLVKRIRQGRLPKAVELNVHDVHGDVAVASGVVAHGVVEHAEAAEAFDINERFEFVTDLMNMVIDGTQPSVVVTGEGGLGKTFTVRQALKDAGLRDTKDSLRALSDLDSEVDLAVVLTGDYTIVKGYSTARGLYRTLFENRDRIVIFDDCDSILKDAVGVSILKSALDSYDERWISWNSDSWDESLPKSFLFTGQVVFISNLRLNKLDQAIRSRSMCVDLTMTLEQKIDRMEHLIGEASFLPEYNEEYKLDALAFIDEFKHRAKEVSLRTLISVTKIRAGKSRDWKKLAQYVLCNN